MAKPVARKRNRVEKGVEELRDEIRDVLNLAEFSGKRVVITRYGKPAAAIVSMADLEKIEAA